MAAWYFYTAIFTEIGEANFGVEKWDQERAAEELGVSLRSYKRYEKAREIARLIELTTLALSMHYK